MLRFQFFITVTIISVTKSQVYLYDPPSRSSLWRFGFDTPVNNVEPSCGGPLVHHFQNRGRCGVCGDPYHLPQPRPNEARGLYGQGIIAKSYGRGQIINAVVNLPRNNLGYFEFKLCPHNQPYEVVSQDCLDQYPLAVAVDPPSYRFKIEPHHIGRVAVPLALPEDLTCSQCVLQWHYAGNQNGMCTQSLWNAGCHPQETYRSCSDIEIVDNNIFNIFIPAKVTTIGPEIHAGEPVTPKLTIPPTLIVPHMEVVPPTSILTDIPDLPHDIMTTLPTIITTVITTEETTTEHDHKMDLEHNHGKSKFHNHSLILQHYLYKQLYRDGVITLRHIHKSESEHNSSKEQNFYDPSPDHKHRKKPSSMFHHDHNLQNIDPQNMKYNRSIIIKHVPKKNLLVKFNNTIILKQRPFSDPNKASESNDDKHDDSTNKQKINRRKIRLGGGKVSIGSSTQPSESDSSENLKKDNCRAAKHEDTIQFIPTVDLDDFCKTKCASGYCPSYLCTCL